MLIIDDMAINSHEVLSHMMICLKRSKSDPFGAGFKLHLERICERICEKGPYGAKHFFVVFNTSVFQTFCFKMSHKACS